MSVYTAVSHVVLKSDNIFYKYLYKINLSHQTIISYDWKVIKLLFQAICLRIGQFIEPYQILDMERENFSLDINK